LEENEKIIKENHKKVEQNKLELIVIEKNLLMNE